MLSVRERTLVLEFASARYFPVSTHLGLLLHLVLSDEVVPLLFVFEVLLRLFESGELDLFVGLIINRY